VPIGLAVAGANRNDFKMMNIWGTVTYYRPPLSRFARHFDRQDHPTHLDLARLVRDTRTANHFVAASSSIAKGVEGSKNKAGSPL